MAAAGAKTIATFGGGSFGTALSTVLARNGHTVRIYMRNGETAAAINKDHRNPRYFTDHLLPSNLSATTNAAEALAGADFILHCIPVQQSLDYITNLKDLISPTIPIISTSKGLHVGTLMYMSQLVPLALGRSQPLVFLSGPSFAKELMDSQPTAVVAASTESRLAEDVQRLFSSKMLRVYTTSDIIGVEVGGALKNVLAIAAGVVEGLGLGLNTMAALITRGCNEMNRLAVAMGGDAQTLAGLSGMGDLMLTCFGTLSRNRSVGLRLGKGESIAAIMESMSEVAEGVYTAPAAVKLAQQYQLNLPILRTVAELLAGKMEPRAAVVHLMTQPLGVESNFGDSMPSSPRLSGDHSGTGAVDVAVAAPPAPSTE